jgi:hypothetical protein
VPRGHHRNERILRQGAFTQGNNLSGVEAYPAMDKALETELTARLALDAKVSRLTHRFSELPKRIGADQGSNWQYKQCDRSHISYPHAAPMADLQTIHGLR